MDPTTYYVGTVQSLWNSVRDSTMDTSDVQRFINIVSGAIAQLGELLESSILTWPKKRIGQTSYGQLLSIRRILEDHLKTGGSIREEVTEKRVLWDEGPSAFKNNIRTGVISNVKHLDVTSFLTEACTLFEGKIFNILQEHDSLKVDTVLAAEFAVIKNDEETIEVKYFNTKSVPVYKTTVLKEWFNDNVKQPIERDIEEFQERDSGWTLRNILNLTVNIKKFIPLHAKSYIPLPATIEKRKACVNVQNQDNQCFKWAVLSALHPANNHVQRVTKYKHYENELNFKSIDFPVSPKQIPKFERQNDISINLFMLKKKGNNFNVSPCHLTSTKKDQHINLLIIQDHYIDEDEEEEEQPAKVLKFHYVWIKDLSRLVSSQLTLRNGRRYICDRCLHYFRDQCQLKTHELDCAQINKCKVLLPTNQDSTLAFKNYNYKERVPIVVYADFECILKPIMEERAYQQHAPFSV